MGGLLGLITVGCAGTTSVSHELREVAQVAPQPAERASPPQAEPVAHDAQHSTATSIVTAPPVAQLAPAEIVIFSFEGSLDGWVIPDWAKGSSDHVGEEILVSQDYAKDGQSALELRAGFTGYRWTGAYVEREVDATDWSPFGRFSVDIYLPEGAPEGLGGKIILTTGDDWEWVEMNRTIPLRPGAWTTVTVDLQPHSMDWKFFPGETFRTKVRKMGVRIESNREPAYRGSVYLDNIRLTESF